MDGPGHYLGSEQTLKVMQSEYIYPDLADRSTPSEWEANGKHLALDGAIARRDAIVSGYFPKHISDETDALIRERFPIFLDRKAMGRN